MNLLKMDFHSDHKNITAKLIENGADVNIVDEHGQTPLHLSAKKGKTHNLLPSKQCYEID